jgi:CHASE2 domain-containing sensor protein
MKRPALLDPSSWVRHHRETVSRMRFAWLVMFTLGWIALSWWLSEHWIFQYANLQVNESLLGLNKPAKAEHTAIVYVDSEDYREYFRGTSPLNPKVLKNAVCAIMADQPRVLLVDFDTSDQTFRNLAIPESEKTRIVWARSLHRFRGKTYAGAVLGEASGEESQGFAATPADEDGAVRGFPREIFVPEEPLGGKFFATAHWRAVQEYRRKSGEKAAEWGTLQAESTELEVARLSSNFEFPQYPLREFLPTDDSCGKISKAKLTHNFADKVVLFGGNYDFSDVHRNPFEEKWGVELLGSAIETELSGHGEHHFTFWAKLGIKMLLAAAIGLLFHYLYALPATLLSLFGLGGTVAFASVAAVFLGSYEGEVVPFVLGLVIEQLVNLVEQAQHAQSEVEYGGQGHSGAKVVSQTAAGLQQP